MNFEMSCDELDVICGNMSGENDLVEAVKVLKLHRKREELKKELLE